MQMRLPRGIEQVLPPTAVFPARLGTTLNQIGNTVYPALLNRIMQGGLVVLVARMQISTRINQHTGNLVLSEVGSPMQSRITLGIPNRRLHVSENVFDRIQIIVLNRFKQYRFCRWRFLNGRYGLFFFNLLFRFCGRAGTQQPHHTYGTA